MTSDLVYVWRWLPNATEPILCGRLIPREQGVLGFQYAQAYLNNSKATSLYSPELPLRRGVQDPAAGHLLPGCLRDAAPDQWGRRVILYKRANISGRDVDTGDLDETTYLLESGSDRFGALDFQTSPDTYTPRTAGRHDLEALQQAVDAVDQGIPLSAELATALTHGTSIGGARPKATIVDGDSAFIAKFSCQTDRYPVIKGEALAMLLAKKVGLSVAPVTLTSAAGRDVLLVRRFDRKKTEAGWIRQSVVSGLTILGLIEEHARYASYADLADSLRAHGSQPQQDLRELFARLVFNILTSNTDDHARNHAAFWEQEALTLTPAYDCCPQLRDGGVAGQAMLIQGNRRESSLALALEASGPEFLLKPHEAIAIIEQHIITLKECFSKTAEVVGLGEVDARGFWSRQFLPPFSYESGTIPKGLAALAQEVKRIVHRELG